MPMSPVIDAPLPGEADPTEDADPFEIVPDVFGDDTADDQGEEKEKEEGGDFDEEDFDDDFDDDFEDEMEDDYPFEEQLGGADVDLSEDGLDGDINIVIPDDDEDGPVEPVEDDAEPA